MGSGPRGLCWDNEVFEEPLGAIFGRPANRADSMDAMALRLRNTLTRRVEQVEPLEPGRVRMYTCGPTVYRYAHVGNLRSNLLADLIRRVAALPRHRRLPRQEHHRRRPPARRGLRSRPGPDAGGRRPRAQDAGRDRRRVRGRIPRRRGGRQHPARPRLPARDRAHPRDADARRGARGRRLRLRHARTGNVYYDVGRFAGYGQLSGNTLADLRAGHRGDIEPDKHDPADFALWKAAGPGRILKWPSDALGRGLPGLAHRVLGDGDALPRPAVRHPHRRHRQRLPAPRGRDRAVRADRRRPARPDTGSTASSC